MVSLHLDKAGELVDDPQIAPFGLPDTDDEGEPMEEIVLRAVLGAVKSIPKSRRKDKDLVAEAARRAARSAVLDVWGKKTLCKVLVTRA